MTRKPTLPEPWLGLTVKLGSVQALADALRCDVSTLRRWAAGKRTPDLAHAAWISEVFRRNHMVGPFDKGF